MASPLKRPLPLDLHTDNDPSTPTVARQSSPASSSLSTPVDVDTPKDTPMASVADEATPSASPSKTPTAPQSSTAASKKLASTQPAKRRRLTPQEKLDQAAEKAKKAAEKEAARAQKEAELKAKEDERQRKALEKEQEKKQKEEEKKAKDEERKLKQQEKDEEKRKKAEAREQKQHEKDQEKKAKEEEKQQKEEEKERKERAQMRLSSFFGAPKGSSPAKLPQGKTLKAAASPSKLAFITKEDARRRSLSLDSVDFEPSSETKAKAPSNSSKQTKTVEKGFWPFVVTKNMTLAPVHPYFPNKDDLDSTNAIMDSYFENAPEPRPSVLETFATCKTTRGFKLPQVQDVLRRMDASQALSSPKQTTTSKALKELHAIPTKYFFFGEDVRPRYRGTWTRPVDTKKARTLSLAPLAQVLPEVNYDYDSEAEWDDADEGEDIDIDDNEEEEEDEEEMDGFIDDDNEPQYLAKRGMAVKDLEPVCSGLQWEDSKGKLKAADPNGQAADFSGMGVCFLLDPSPKTIDPFTSAYWEPEAKTAPVLAGMGPPRLPLSDRTNGQGNVQTFLVNGKVPKATKAAPRLVPADILPAFKTAVSGSDMTKIALIESLKKQFPKLRKDEITETLPLIAKRVGPKQTEKRWELIAESKI